MVIHKMNTEDYGYEENALTPEGIGAMPKVKKLPKGAIEHTQEADREGEDIGPFHEAYQQGYKVYRHPTKEAAYLSKDDGKKEHERDHWRKK